MRGWVDLLVILSGVLPIVGFLWGWHVARQRLAELDRQRERIATVHRETREANYPVDQRAPNPADILRAEGIPFTTYADLLYLRQDIETAILR